MQAVGISLEEGNECPLLLGVSGGYPVAAGYSGSHFGSSTPTGATVVHAGACDGMAGGTIGLPLPRMCEKEFSFCVQLCSRLSQRHIVLTQT